MLRGICVIAAILLIAVAAGCGSSSDADTADTAGTTTTAVSQGPSLSKAAFIKRADAICESTDNVQRKAIAVYTKKNPGNQSSTLWLTGMIRAVAIPPINNAAEELRELGPPSGDEEEIDQIITGIEEATKKAEEDPSSVITSSGPFAAVGKLASKYGFVACAQPL